MAFDGNTVWLDRGEKNASRRYKMADVDAAQAYEHYTLRLLDLWAYFDRQPVTTGMSTTRCWRRRMESTGRPSSIERRARSVIVPASSTTPSEVRVSPIIFWPINHSSPQLVYTPLSVLPSVIGFRLKTETLHLDEIREMGVLDQDEHRLRRRSSARLLGKRLTFHAHELDAKRSRRSLG